MIQRIPFSLLSLVLVTVSQLDCIRAQRAFNQTIDDNNSTIHYSPGWTVSQESALDFGGSHHLTDQSNADARFVFTGIAIYFLSPRWPYSVGVKISVDDFPSSVVDLRDHSLPFNANGGPETVASETVWSMQGLENIQHTVIVQFATDVSDYCILDALIYTSVEPGDDFPGNLTTTPSMPAGTSTGSSSPTSFPRCDDQLFCYHYRRCYRSNSWNIGLDHGDALFALST
ncbi:hypothetical protein C8J56DRAFT_19319 [Mycena floridula]|nr:hypothetical protein C8J56DRAFT_19319 [Mycena floridula]